MSAVTELTPASFATRAAKPASLETANATPIWGSVLGFPGAIVRLNPGSNPPETTLAEVYEPPMPGFSPRGGDVDRNGVYWTALASGHLASFDRRNDG